MRYDDVVTHPISVRLDDEARRALSVLEATGVSRSTAVRDALIAAASRLRERRALAAEVAALEADDADRAERMAIIEFFGEPREPR